MILHIYCKKSRPKIYPIFLRSEENDGRKNFYTKQCPNLCRFFVWITVYHGRVHEKRPKDTEETWILTEEQENRQKAGLKSCFWALIGTKRDESAFLGRRAGRRVSVSKSGLSRRDRDGWQVCNTVFRGKILAGCCNATQGRAAQSCRWSVNLVDRRSGAVAVAFQSFIAHLQVTRN